MTITGGTRGFKYMSRDKGSKTDTNEILSDNAKGTVRGRDWGHKVMVMKDGD
jgi:hypothetical protein